MNHLVQKKKFEKIALEVIAVLIKSILKSKCELEAILQLLQVLERSASSDILDKSAIKDQLQKSKIKMQNILTFY